MLKNSFFAILIVTLCMTCVGRATVLQDDINTFGLWHADEFIGGIVSPDDTSVTLGGRTPVDMTINNGNSLITLSAGQYGQALDFGTDGRQLARFSSSFPGGSAPAVDAMGSEFKFDAWFYIPDADALPLPTSDGGLGVGDEYVFYISTNAGSYRGYMHITPPSTVGSYKEVQLKWRKYNNSSGEINVPIYRYDPVTDLPLPSEDPNALDLTGKWIHVVALAQYTSPEPAWDPDYNRTELSITDSSTATTYTATGDNTGVFSGSGSTVCLGQLTGKTGCTPYRGYKGLIDELKISGRVHEPMVAYGPTPYRAQIISPTSNLTASWHKAAPFNPVDTITQNVWVGLTPTPPDVNVTDPNWAIVAPGITGNTADLGAVAFGETWYWKVDSIDSGTGLTTASPIWSFTVNDIPPVVDVGLDHVTWLVGGTRTISLTPTVTDADTNPGLLTYSWTQIAGPAATIVSPSSKDTDIVFTTIGPAYFQLTVNDENNSVSDVVRVQVFNTPCAASQSLGTYVAQSTDFNDDCSVNFSDFASIAANWAKCNSLDPACL